MVLTIYGSGTLIDMLLSELDVLKAIVKRPYTMVARKTTIPHTNLDLSTWFRIRYSYKGRGCMRIVWENILFL